MDQPQTLRKVVKDKATRTQLRRTRILNSLKRNSLRMIMKQQAFLCALRKVNAWLGNDVNELKRQRTQIRATGSTWVAHGVYSTLDTMIAKYPRLCVLLFFCFVLCPVFFLLNKINHTANNCTGRRTRNIMNPALAGPMRQHLLAIVRAFFIIVNGTHTELHWTQITVNIRNQ